ncbi:Hpt domain-containing protein [Pantoea dispersa]|uniref:Hpt domain-containing protein n=1 Tax=Pantoea dispersa TaxID=59814 RepID=UPI002DBC1ED0|nr:Hpt domain-containing protein [Pantoea dispersa]MEB5973403.1 Hpt domain-containing protein [Pantoea dispersa]
MDRQIEDAMMKLMVTTLNDDLARMARLSLPVDAIQVADVVHRITGSLRIARQSRLAQACMHLEAQCRAGIIPGSVLDAMYKNLYQQLENYLLRLRQVSKLADVIEEND